MSRTDLTHRFVFGQVQGACHVGLVGCDLRGQSRAKLSLQILKQSPFSRIGWRHHRGKIEITCLLRQSEHFVLDLFVDQIRAKTADRFSIGRDRLFALDILGPDRVVVQSQYLGGTEVTSSSPSRVLDQFAAHLLHDKEGAKHQHQQRGAEEKEALSLQAHRRNQALQEANHGPIGGYRGARLEANGSPGGSSPGSRGLVPGSCREGMLPRTRCRSRWQVPEGTECDRFGGSLKTRVSVKNESSASNT